MEIYVPGIILILLSLVLSTRIGLVAAGGILVPFPITNIIAFGDTGLVAADFFYLSIVAAFAFQRISRTVPKSYLLLITFATYAVFSAVVFPRVFSGIHVIPVDLKSGYIRISNLIPTSLAPLMPSGSNLSQTFYALAGIAYIAFFASVASERKYKIHLLIKVAAITNLMTSCTALVAGPYALSYFSTTSNNVLFGSLVGGSNRMMAAFNEASRYADFTSVVAIYFVAHYLSTKSRSSLIIGLTSFVFNILSLSSTAFAAAGIGSLFLIWRSFSTPGQTVRVASMTALTVFLGMALIAIYPDIVQNFLNLILFEKGQSISGLERGIWMRYGIATFFDTYFLGAGTGSVRSNGLIAVLLSNVGIVGAYLFSRIIYRSLKSKEISAIDFCLKAGLVTIITSRLISIDVMTMGVFFCALVGACYPSGMQTKRRLSTTPSVSNLAATRKIPA